uniref:CSON005764 protein n=1 Tax=Culicoides sonorensis TaxID=179676 RepID=A0A336MW74_CULSO
MVKFQTMTIKIIFILGFTSILIVSSQSQAPPMLENHFEWCINVTKVDRTIALKARSHDLSFIDHKGNCFLYCICSGVGFCDKDLKLVTKFLEQGTDIDKEKIRNAGEKCNQISTEDECDTVFERFKCFFDHVPETPVH